MNVAEFRKMTSVQINEELTALLRKQFNLRMQKGSGQQPKSSEIRAVRKDIARLKTVMREMQK